MTRLDILQEAYEMAQHNLLCYSADYSMERPRKTSLREWKKAKEEVEILKVWIEELEREGRYDYVV